MSADQLFKLPNGTWLRPSSVIAIIPAEAVSGMLGEYKQHEPIKPRVTVRYSREETGLLGPSEHFQSEIIYCDTFEAATTLADEIALAVWHLR